MNLGKSTTIAAPAASADAVVWFRAALPAARGCCCLALLVLLSACGCDNKNQVSDEDFHTGRSLVIRGKYAEAIPSLERYLKEQPKGKQAGRAGLFLGESPFGARRFCRGPQSF